MKHNLLIIANRTLHSAPRVIREIEALKKNFNITAVGITAPTDNAISFININTLELNLPLKILRRLLKFIFKTAFLEVNLPVRMRKLRKLINRSGATYVIIHETEFLPSLIKIKKKQDIKIILNAHEYYPAEFENDTVWERTYKVYYEKIYRECLPKIDLMINVCQSIADKCKECYGVNSIVIPNAAVYHNLTPHPIAAGEKIKLIHHGAAIKSRMLETMMEVADELGEGYQLDLMLVSSSKETMDYFTGKAAEFKNVNIIPSVSFNEIIPFANKYDIGIYILAPLNFNNRVALPNKIFEFIQSRLCLAVSPNIEMKNLVEENKLGVVSEGYDKATMVAAIKSLSINDIIYHKQQADLAAKKINAEHFEKILLDAVCNV